MSPDTLEVRAAIARELSIPEAWVGPEVLLEDLVPSSFSLVELVLELQECYAIRLTQDDFREVRTVGDLATLVAARRRERASRC